MEAKALGCFCMCAGRRSTAQRLPHQLSRTSHVWVVSSQYYQAAVCCL